MSPEPQALPRLDTIAILRRELPEYGVPPGSVASIAGVPSGRMSRYMNGAERCGGEHDLRLRQTWTSLKALIKLVDPLPLNYSKAEALRKSLDAIADGSLFIVTGDTRNKE
jgi:hypothetical protein